MALRCICGIPCSGTVEIWFVRDGLRHMIEVDTPTIHHLLDRLWRGEEENRGLPVVLRDYFAWTGWYDFDAPEAGTPVAHEEMLATLALLADEPLDARERQICAALERLTREAQATAAPLFMHKD